MDVGVIGADGSVSDAEGKKHGHDQRRRLVQGPDGQTAPFHLEGETLVVGDKKIDDRRQGHPPGRQRHGQADAHRGRDDAGPEAHRARPARDPDGLTGAGGRTAAVERQRELAAVRRFGAARTGRAPDLPRRAQRSRGRRASRVLQSVAAKVTHAGQWCVVGPPRTRLARQRRRRSSSLRALRPSAYSAVTLEHGRTRRDIDSRYLSRSPYSASWRRRTPDWRRCTCRSPSHRAELLGELADLRGVLADRLDIVQTSVHVCEPADIGVAALGTFDCCCPRSASTVP